MLSLILLFVPLVAGFVIWLSPSNFSKRIAFGAAVVEMLLGVAAYFYAFSQQPQLLKFSIDWVAQLGIKFSLNADGISMVMLLLTTFLVPFIVLASSKYNYEKANVFYALIFFMQCGMVGVFMAQDAFLFYVFCRSKVSR